MKEKLLFQLTNAGNPFIYVDDANYENRGELLLKHDHQGIDLRQDYAREVLESMQAMWRRPVQIRTHGRGQARPAPLRRQGPLPAGVGQPRAAGTRARGSRPLQCELPGQVWPR